MTASTSGLRVLLLFALAASIGVILAVIKGRGYDLGYIVGNAAAPYAVIAFFMGRSCKRRSIAVAAGVLSTLIALAAFYSTASGLYLGRLSMDFSIGRWFALGVLSGAALGAIGHLSRSRRWLLLVPPALLAFEPLATFISDLGGFAGETRPTGILVASLIQILEGTILALLLIKPLRRQHDRARRSS